MAFNAYNIPIRNYNCVWKWLYSEELHPLNTAWKGQAHELRSKEEIAPSIYPCDTNHLRDENTPHIAPLGLVIYIGTNVANKANIWRLPELFNTIMISLHENARKELHEQAFRSQR